MPQNSLAGGRNWKYHHQGAFPSPGRLFTHPSSCIFRQCCHRVVREHPDAGRALSHRPGPLCGHPRQLLLPGLLETRRPWLNISPPSSVLGLKSSVSLQLLTWRWGLKIFSPSGFPKCLLRRKSRASSLHDAQLCNSNPIFSRFSGSRSFTWERFLQLSAPFPPIWEAAS